MFSQYWENSEQLIHIISHRLGSTAIPMIHPVIPLTFPRAVDHLSTPPTLANDIQRYGARVTPTVRWRDASLLILTSSHHSTDVGIKLWRSRIWSVACMTRVYILLGAPFTHMEDCEPWCYPDEMVRTRDIAQLACVATASMMVPTGLSRDGMIHRWDAYLATSCPPYHRRHR